MRVVIRPFFTICKALGGAKQLDVELEQPTVRRVLYELRRQFGAPFWGELFDLGSDQPLENTQILINGRHYRHFSGGLEHELTEGDELALFPAVAGG